MKTQNILFEQRVETSDGSLGTALNYDKNTDTCSVRLDSGRVEHVKVTELKQVSLLLSGSAKPNPPDRAPGGDDNW